MRTHKKFLKTSEYKHLASDIPNTELKFNHDNCSAGVDTKERLYVKRVNSSTVTAYCHNCGRGGVWKSRGGRRSRDVRLHYSSHNSAETSSNNDVTRESLGRDVALDAGGWPNEATSWLYRYGITDEEIERYGIGYHLPTGRVYLPMQAGMGHEYGFILRSVFDHEQGPKYLTKKMVRPLEFDIMNKENTSCVIVEDMISAIKVGRYANVVTILGSHLDNVKLDFIGGVFTDVVIWMDNDNIVIKKKQNEYKKVLDLFCDNVTIIKTDKDPKDHSDEEIRRLLCLS